MATRWFIEKLYWDDWNLDHIAKHRVSAEQVIACNPVALETYMNRLGLIGPTVVGRMLMVIIGPVPESPRVYYVFSARPANRKERRYCLDSAGGATQ